MPIEIIKVWKYKAGYNVVYEKISGEEAGGSESFVMRSATTPEGDYIGTPKMARFLIKRGIKPEKRNIDSNICTIGFSQKENKWFGWSHRAICGFTIGDVVDEGDSVASSGWTDEYLAEHPEDDLSLPVGFEAETMEDAKQMAIAFAESVG